MKDGDLKAAFNNEKGKQVLQQLKDMRWTDNSMGARQLLEWADLLQMMAGRQARHVHRPHRDNLPMHRQPVQGRLQRLRPRPDARAARRTLAGGEGYMFKEGLCRRRSRPA